MKRINSVDYVLLFSAACVLLFATIACNIGSQVSQEPTKVTASSTPLATQTTSAERQNESPAEESQQNVLIPQAEVDAELPSKIPHYIIDLQIDETGHTFSGVSTLEYSNMEVDHLNKLFFRLFPNGGGGYGNGKLNVTAVRVDDIALPTELTMNDSVMNVPLPDTLHTGESIELEIEFEGIVPVDFGGDDPSFGYGIYNYSNGVLSLSGWYPILAVYDDEGWNLDPVSDIGDSVYSDTANYSISVNAPAGNVLISTGTNPVLSETTSDSFEIQSPPARDFFLIMSPDFQVASLDVDGTTVNSYFLPGHEAGGQLALDIASDSLGAFNELFGPYPYSELDVVEAPMRYALGVEYPGVILIRESLYDNLDSPNFTVAIAHEVAHQWWYNIVGNDVIDEPWLDEALTTYSSSLFYEFGPQQTKPTGLYNYWQEQTNILMQEGKDDLITQDLAYFENHEDPRVYSRVVYSKGALFFKTLREEIGDQAFFEALQIYYQDNRYQIATPEELLGIFEQAAGRQLDEFYDEWLYSATK
ncbi:M1 family metallopeptidase [Chloroflexota bacterium]